MVVRVEADRAGEVSAALDELAEQVRRDSLFAERMAPETQTARTSANERVSVMTLAVPHKQSSQEALDSLHRLRNEYLPTTVGDVPGVEVAVSGNVARSFDYLAHQNKKLPLVVGALLLLTLLMTVMVFRSVVIGLLGVVLNMLSVGAAMGLLVIFFQWGLASTLFGFDPSATSAIGSRVPLFLFVILFGLSMDYQVFVVSRIREAVSRGTSTHDAVLEGIGRSAKVVTSAAIVMVTVFASFMLLHLAEMKQIGFSLAVAVLIDAFVVRVLILPATLTLLGCISWWPSRAARRAPDRPVADSAVPAAHEAGAPTS